MESANIHVQFQGCIAVLVIAFIQLCFDKEIADLNITLGIEVDVSEDTALVDIVLVLQIAADRPTEHLERKGIFLALFV